MPAVNPGEALPDGRLSLMHQISANHYKSAATFQIDQGKGARLEHFSTILPRATPRCPLVVLDTLVV